MTTPETPREPARSGGRFAPIAAALITALIPLLLVLISVRLVMTPQFLAFEYNRPDFPVDIYGFTREDRLYFAPFAVDYLLNDAGIEYLGDLTFDDGRPLFNARELGHMVDVKMLTRAALTVLTVALPVALVLGVLLARQPQHRPRLGVALMTGGSIALLLMVTVAGLALVAWDTFFTGFHQAFFADGTWIFDYSDTLIRLFPERFWFDAALTIGVLTAVGALICIAAGWGLARPRARREPL
jgi:integral membrane protein (TIGR01906 family)